MKYIAGTNTPGYTPDSMPSSFDNFEGARDFIVDEMTRDASDESLSYARSQVLYGQARLMALLTQPFTVVAGGRAYWVEVEEDVSDDDDTTRS